MLKTWLVYWVQIVDDMQQIVQNCLREPSWIACPRCSRISASMPAPFSGTFCGTSAFDGSQTRSSAFAAGREVVLKLADERALKITGADADLFPRPYRHRLSATQASATQLVCASLNFDGGSGNALAGALPDYMVLKLDEIPTLASTLEWLFNEAFDGTCGREAVMDRLFELLVILLLRHILSSRNQQPGMMAGLADSRLARP
jgi:hypothetical protein